MQHQDKTEQYKRYRELTGEDADEVKAAPRLHSWNIMVWQAFSVLSGSRQFGMGGAAPIPFSETRCYLEWMQLDRDTEEDWLYLIQAMDTIYLEETHKKKE